MGVHEEHCCLEHGCKYGEDDCPVANGITKQKYDCEFCHYERKFPEDITGSSLQIIGDGVYKVMKDHPTIDVQIIGDGVFGTFLRDVYFKMINGINVVDESNVKILAIPISGYTEGNIRKYCDPDDILVNVCSVQQTPNIECAKISNKVVGIHYMFGPNTPMEYWNCVVTRNDAPEVTNWLTSNCIHTTELNDAIHDMVMVKVHKKALELMMELKQLMKDTEGVSDYLIPNSFRKLRDFVAEIKDMPEGTRESILSNEG